MEPPIKQPDRIKLTEINPHLTCYLCKGYLIDATTICECLHSFCRSCIIKFLQDNSFCPVCEMIINKAKPNLKLDKTLQDIVYKLVPELFLGEMTRRKLFYQQYPEVAAHLAPEERGEDTERTIFNPQDCISLSLEYVSDDSAPGAIRFSDSKNGLDTIKQLTAEESQAHMKRYLQCPGMCRVEVLKKFVRNKYNVDTNMFYIDILYKKIPLPDHYTLIDIAYIYSWKRNEPMKLYFRIADICKISEHLDSPDSLEHTLKVPMKSRKNSDKTGCRRRDVGNKRGLKFVKKPSQERVSVCVKDDFKDLNHTSENDKKDINVKTENKCDNSNDNKIKTDSENSSRIINENKENENDGRNALIVTEKTKIKDDTAASSDVKCSDEMYKNKIETINILKNNDNINSSCKNESCNPDGANSIMTRDTENASVEKKLSSVQEKHTVENSTPTSNNSFHQLSRENPNSSTSNCSTISSTIQAYVDMNVSKEMPFLENRPPVRINSKSEKGKQKLSKVKQKTLHTSSDNSLQPEITQQMKDKIQNEIQNDNCKVKNSVYTNITLNRTNNVEIITKIQKVSNKDGQPIGLKVINQTVKKGTGPINAPSFLPEVNTAPLTNTTEPSNLVDKNTTPQVPVSNNSNNLESDISNPPQNVNVNIREEMEKRKFLQSVQLTPKNPLPIQQQHQDKEPVKKLSSSQKRKTSSPVKNDKTKVPKLDRKSNTKIIIQPKPKASSSVNACAQASCSLQNNGLQSLIENCKIPSSLSITIKESTDNNRLPSLPPVKNFIEILKLPDENCPSNSSNDSSTLTKFDFSSKLCDNDSEQKVDQDIAEIARSLTEKIPLSTTISQIVGPKPQFPIPVRSIVPAKLNVQPTPLPDVSKIFSVPKENKLNPRSPQTFQKIFEESIKKCEISNKTDEKDQKIALDLTNDSNNSSTKRNILEIAQQLYKKTKLEQGKNQSEIGNNSSDKSSSIVPKIPIPRLSTQKILKQKSPKPEVSDSLKFQQTLSNMHSNALGLNYSISVGPNNCSKINGIVQLHKKETPTSDISVKGSNTGINNIIGNEIKSVTPTILFSLPKDLQTSSPRPAIPRNMSPSLNYNSPRNSPKHSPKSSPVIKHMYAPMPNLVMDPLKINTFGQKTPSPKLSEAPKSSPTLYSPSAKLSSPVQNQLNTSPKPVPNICNLSPKSTSPLLSPKPPSTSSSNCSSKTPQASSSKGSSPCKTSKPTSNSSGNITTMLNPNEILEKYNIQNLAQLTASLNFNAAAGFGLSPNNQLAALQHAMLLKHFEMQNRQNWLQGPLLQYEKYLQSLKTNQNHLLGNIKEN